MIKIDFVDITIQQVLNAKRTPVLTPFEQYFVAT